MQITDVVLGLAAGVGIDLSPDGKTAYYVEWSIGRVSKVDVQTGMVTTVVERLQYPEDVLVDWATGDVFVSERIGSVVQVWSNEKRTVATPGYAPHQLALVRESGNRYLYTVCFDSGQLIRIDLNSGGAIQVITGGLGHPVGLVIDSAHKYAYVTEQDTSALTRIELSTTARQQLYTGLTQPFYLAWDKNTAGLYCVQRDPANSLVKLDIGPPATTVAAGLAWRPSDVAPNSDDSLIYICSDRKIEVISFDGAPPIPTPPPPFEIESIKFNFDNNRAIPLKHHLTATNVAVPEYIKGVRNEPAAFRAGWLVKLKVVLRRRAGFSPGTYTIGATGSHGGVRYKDVMPAFGGSGLTGEIDFEFMWPLPYSVERLDVSLDWFARKQPGPSIPTPCGSAIHRIYVALRTPTAPWNTQPTWVAAMDLACGWAAGATNVDDAAALITQRYNGCGVLSYDDVGGRDAYGYTTFNLTEMLERLNGGPGLGEKVNCTDSANTVSTLANVIGCDLWQSQMWQGFRLNDMIAIGGNTWGVPFNGFFNYHEVVWKGAADQNENVFDGCLKVDGDADPTQAPHTPLLATNILFGDCTTINYRRRLCPPTADGCSRCNPDPTTRQRRPII